MSNGNDLNQAPGVFEPVRDAFRYKLPSAGLERLCDLSHVPAHFRPTFANAMNELFAKAQRWHRIAVRSVEMDATAKELDRIAKAARRLKEDIDKLGPQARATLGLYALRLDQFSEADPQDAVRNQIEDLVNAGGYAQAGPKVAQLSWAAGRIEAAANTETWPRPKGGALTPWKNGGGDPKVPYIETFNRFIMELARTAEACNSPLRFDPNDLNDHVLAFLEAAIPLLPNGFIPPEVFQKDEPAKTPADSRLKKLTAFWSKTQ